MRSGPSFEILSYIPDANSELISVWVKNGHRPNLDKIPSDAPSELVEIITACWVAEPAERLGFKGELVERSKNNKESSRSKLSPGNIQIKGDGQKLEKALFKICIYTENSTPGKQNF